MTAAVTVTARIQMTQFFCIDLNMRPYFSSTIRSYVDVRAVVRTDMDQPSRWPLARDGVRTAAIFIRMFTVALSGYDRRVSLPVFHHNIRFHMPVPVSPPLRWPPEVDLLVLSFLGHFTWEILQAPLFASLSGTGHFVGIAICLKATFGDLAIALAAFWCAAFAGKGRNWVANTGTLATAVFFVVGLLTTIGLEYLNTDVTGRWAYDGVMPLLPVLGTGLSPILQWIFVPMFVLWYMRRLMPEIVEKGHNPDDALI